jgi:hypothetical protein
LPRLGISSPFKIASSKNPSPAAAKTFANQKFIGELPIPQRRLRESLVSGSLSSTSTSQNGTFSRMNQVASPVDVEKTAVPAAPPSEGARVIPAQAGIQEK